MFLQRRHTDGQEAHEKMLNITNQRNENQNHNEVSLSTIKKSTHNNSCRGCGEKRALQHCMWEYKLVQSLWRTVWTFLKKLKI